MKQSKIKKLEKQAVENDDNEAAYSLAMMYFEGEIVKQDKKKAVSLLSLAANRGHLPSNIYLKTLNITDTVFGVVKTVEDIKRNILED